jgi:filamentous hemagglutinin family protein
MMEKLRKKIKGQCFRKVIIYFLTWCMVLNTSLPAVLATPTPVGDGFTLGDGSISQVGNATNVVIDQLQLGHAVIEWSSLDTDGGLPADRESLNFSQDGVVNSAVLNRVMSGLGTQFYGDLNAEAGMRIFMVNPAGIVFHEGSTVNVTQLIASNLDISNSQFETGEYEFLGDIEGVEIHERLGVINNGAITTIPGGGDVAEGVALIGQKILNTGTITTGAGGFVVMAAGDRVLLGEPGSKIVVEMDSVTLTDPENPEDFGDVVNEGEITSPGGKVVLAAGDILSVPLHPQLKVNSGTVEEPVYEPADQPVRVESGIGKVTQSGGITADGGSVILTAGDDVILAAGSETQAIDGEVIAYAYDFDTKEATTSFEGEDTLLELEGATISVGTGTAEICGNHILFAGSVDALPGGTIQVDPLTLTIADTMPGTGPELDTLYEEEHIEFYSQAGVNLNLAADDMITVEYMADSDIPGEITGGSGDIYLRNIFADGGIYFEQEDEDGQTGPRSSIHTEAYYVGGSIPVYRNGGNIYMDAGSGGIVAGDLSTDTESDDKISQPGEIVLRTANGGDIEVGTMQAIGASSTQVSAISDGDLIVNGDVESINKQTDNEETSVFKAIMCLIAEGDIDINGNNYEVSAHGKGFVSSDIRISAGQNVTIGAEDSLATITAESKVSGGEATHSTAYIVIHAGRNLEGSGVISINGQSYTPGEAYLTDGDITAKAWPGPLSIDTDGIPATDGTESVWQDPVPPPEPVDFFAKIEINSNAPDLSQCADCPRPPGLPPVPRLFIIADDSFLIGWAAEDAPLDVLANDDDGYPLEDGIVFEHTATTGGGILTEILDGGEVIGFEYTPPEDAVYTWDGVSDYAEFTDTFTYKAEDSEGNVSVNTATVTITATNFLPTASGDSETIHMSTAGNPTSADFDLTDIIVDPDGTPGTITLAKGDNDVVFGVASVDDSTNTATYEPFEGYVGNDDFDYTVTDSSIDYQGEPVTSATLEVELTNVLPFAEDGLFLDNPGGVPIDGDLLWYDLPDTFAQGEIDALIMTLLENGGTLNPDGSLTTALGGTVTLAPDGESFTYDPPSDSFAGPDSFTFEVWDGQRDYPIEGDPTNVTVTGTITVSFIPVPPPVVPYIQPAPGLQREEIEISGCPALVQWIASELGTDEGQIQVWIANSLASDRGIPPCDACANLKEAATVLQDVDGNRVAALTGIISEFASSTAPPTEEQMASIADAIANDIEGNSQYAAAGEYLDALAKYVGILTGELGFSADESIQFVTDNYVGQLAEGENMGVAAYVAARLAALGGS